MKDIQAVARLEDQAKKMLKQSEQQKKALTALCRKRPPPKLPEYAVAEPHTLATALPLPAPLPPLPALPPPPEPGSEPHEAKPDCDPIEKKKGSLKADGKKAGKMKVKKKRRRRPLQDL